MGLLLPPPLRHSLRGAGPARGCGIGMTLLIRPSPTRLPPRPIPLTQQQLSRLFSSKAFTNSTSPLRAHLLSLRLPLGRRGGPSPPGLAPAGGRVFHSSPRRSDAFFITFPAFKQTLLTITRVTLVILPFAWRWGLFKRFPRGTRSLIWLPLASFMIIIAMGLQQSPKTARWRLLLMSEREELEWSNTRFDEIIQQEELLLVPPSDPRAQHVQLVSERLIQALQDESPVSCAVFPREETLNRLREPDKRSSVVPSARARAHVMPFMPESSNPEKNLTSRAWSIFVIDLPKINAFVLPSTDIFVYSGLLNVVEGDQNLLAAVLAHEIIHVTERHIVEGLGFMALSGVVFDVLRGASWALTLSFPFVGDALAACFNLLDRQIGQRAFSRKLEVEADTMGLELMARAGFDPRAALELWEILNEVEADIAAKGAHGSITDHIALLRTHPTGEQRLAILEQHLPRAIKIYEETLAEHKAHAAVKELLAKPQASEPTLAAVGKEEQAQSGVAPA